MVYERLQRLSDLAQQSLKEHVPTQAEIAKSPTEVLRTRTLASITAKLTVLNSAELVLNDTSHLNATGVESGRADISGAVGGSTALRSSIDAQHNIVLRRRDAGGLVAFSDVGTLIVPKVMILGAADGVLRSDDAVGGQVPTIEKRIGDARSRGRPVAAAQAALADLKVQLTQSTSVAQGLLASVPSITADHLAEISADQAAVAAAKSAIATAQSDIGKIALLSCREGHRCRGGPPTPTASDDLASARRAQAASMIPSRPCFSPPVPAVKSNSSVPPMVPFPNLRPHSPSMTMGAPVASWTVPWKSPVLTS